MLHYRDAKFQIPKRCIELRGQLFGFLVRMCDTKIIEKPEDIEEDRFLCFSHPFENWVFEHLIKNRKQKFFHLDNGYIGNHRHKTPWYYRVSYNSLQNTKVRKPPHSRREFIEIDEHLWKPWAKKNSGEYNLLVLPQESNIFRYLGENYHQWRENTIKKYEAEDVPLVIREKIGKRAQRFVEIPKLIKKAKKVIVYHSMTAVEAICMGKPIEVLGQSAVQHWQGQHGFDREEMLEHIAWSQFDRSNFESGFAWDHTFRYQVNNE